jgi:cell division protein FtsQ
VIGLGVVLVLVAGAVALLHTPLFSARALSVQGVHDEIPTAKIIEAAGLEGHPPLISVNPGAAAKRIEALPFIHTAKVDRHWPDGVTVVVTERLPRVVMAGPGSAWSVLDVTGRTLEVLPSRPPSIALLTVAADGHQAKPARVGHALTGVGSFALVVCRTLPLAFSAQVVSVNEAANGTVSLGLNSGITVLLGTDSDLTAKYEDVAAIIAHAGLHGATTIDVTIPQSPTVTG